MACLSGVLIACSHQTPSFALLLTCWSFHDDFTRCKNQLLLLCSYASSMLALHTVFFFFWLGFSLLCIALVLCVHVWSFVICSLTSMCLCFARLYLRYLFIFYCSHWIEREWIEFTTLLLDSPLLTFSHTFAWTGKLYFCLLMDCM